MFWSSFFLFSLRGDVAIHAEASSGPNAQHHIPWWVKITERLLQVTSRRLDSKCSCHSRAAIDYAWLRGHETDYSTRVYSWLRCNRRWHPSRSVYNDVQCVTSYTGCIATSGASGLWWGGGWKTGVVAVAAPSFRATVTVCLQQKFVEH